MCGIVAYFGGAGNHLTRVLTGMSAITYRAPDSTGIGMFGDECEPIRTRKSLGAVREFIARLVAIPAYPDRAAQVLMFGRGLADSQARVAWQRDLLALEGLPVTGDSCNMPTPPGFDDLVALPAETARRLHPGACGTTDPMPVFRSATPEQLDACVERLVNAYDLSPVVVHSLYRRALTKCLAEAAGGTPETIAADELLALFDQVMEGILTARNTPLHLEHTCWNPQAWQALWQALADCPLAVPDDYDRDGVRGIFRVLDGALLASLPDRPGLRERMDALLDRVWVDRTALRALDWQHIYLLEKSANLFGRAASAALLALQEELVLPAIAADPRPPGEKMSIAPGVTDALSLRLLATPIIAHGRWALQSSVTLANCHPFLDETRQRAIAVNGQFDSEVEAQLSRYLKQVAGLRLRSENSGEYVSLLWGHYYQILHDAQHRYESIRIQNERDLTRYSIGSQAIDYQMYHAVRGRTPEDLDCQAFAAAVRQLTQHDGQIAVTGISRVSARRLYVAAHNRPIFIVRRRDNHDVMVVSDINAAIGLFPQRLIFERSRQLLKELRRCEEITAQMRADSAPRKDIDTLQRQLVQTEERLYADFGVDIFPLEDENRLACIDTVVRGGVVQRDIVLTDLDQRPIEDLDPIATILKPSHVRRDLYASLFVSHQREIPGRLEDILRAYLPEETACPALDLNHKLFERRYGNQLHHLRRIVLAGCGTSFHVALIARTIFRQYLPGFEVIAAQPADLDPLTRFVSPERDLVVLISWSATTADMVELAKMLVRQNVVTVAVTEKKFADLSLIVSRSGGLIQCLSGEEVTVAAVKSTFCLAASLSVLAARLAHHRGDSSNAAAIAAALRRLPERIGALQADPEMATFCNRMAAAYADAATCLVIDAIHQTGTGREAALKLEETSWTSVSRAIDFHDLPPGWPAGRQAGNLVLVNATADADLPAAMKVMEQLHERGIPFIALTCEGPQREPVETFSRGQLFRLPKIEDAFQPFLDLVFYYEFAYRYGISHGQGSEGFPRNRAKSVTVGRSRAARIPSPQGAVSSLTLPAPTASAPHRSAGAGVWEDLDSGGYFRHLHRLAAAPDPPPYSGLQSSDGLSPQSLSHRLFDDLPPDGHLLLVPMDRAAEAAALSAAAQWRAFLPCAVRVERMTRFCGRLPSDALLLLCGTRTPDPELIRRMCAASDAAGWIGSPLSAEGRRALGVSVGIRELPHLPAAVMTDALYLAFCRIFADGWRARDPDRGRILSGHLQLLPDLVGALLEDTTTRRSLEGLLAANRDYPSAFYIGPPGGEGLLWEDAFGCNGRTALVSHHFGECVHGPIVTVDHRVNAKYIRVEKRDAMLAAYGPAAVAEWERAYFNGSPVDGPLTLPEARSDLKPSAFFAEGAWYLPVLRTDYDVRQDNLVILDASSRRHFNLALDELSVFGCRHARLAVMTQKSFEHQPEAGMLRIQPVSHFIALPGAAALGGVIPELLLPVVRHMVAVAAAAISARNIR